MFRLIINWVFSLMFLFYSDFNAEKIEIQKSWRT